MATKTKLKPSDYLKKGWCQFAVAQDKAGHATPCTFPDARKWCLVGAVWAAMGKLDIGFREGVSLENYLLGRLDEAPGHWNDAKERTQAEVIAMMEEAEKAVGIS